MVETHISKEKLKVNHVAAKIKKFFVHCLGLHVSNKTKIVEIFFDIKVEFII